MEVREKILAEATRLIAANGFEGMAIQDVADAVGVKKQSVLYYFPSKDDLRKAVLEELLARWNDILPRLLRASALTGLAKFDAVTSELFEFFTADLDRARLIMRELLDRPDASEVAELIVRPWIDVVASYVRLGQEAGQIQSDVDAEAYVLDIAVMSLAAMAMSDVMSAVLAPKKKEKSTQRRIVKELVRMARTGLFTQSYLAHQREKGASRRGID